MIYLRVYGGTSGAALQVDSMYSAARVTMRPLEYGAGGAYHVSKTFAVGPGTNIAANAAVWSFRWTSATLTALITSFKWNWIVTTAFTGAQVLDHALYVARGFNSADIGTGSSTLTMSGNNAKKRASMSASAVGEIRYATSNTLTAGTRTLDTQPVMYRGGYGSVQGLGLLDSVSMHDTLDDCHPITLAQNEGIVLNNLTVFPAAGVLTMAVEVSWFEVPNAGF